MFFYLPKPQNQEIQDSCRKAPNFQFPVYSSYNLASCGSHRLSIPDHSPAQTPASIMDSKPQPSQAITARCVFRPHPHLPRYISHTGSPVATLTPRCCRGVLLLPPYCPGLCLSGNAADRLMGGSSSAKVPLGSRGDVHKVVIQRGLSSAALQRRCTMQLTCSNVLPSQFVEKG